MILLAHREPFGEGETVPTRLEDLAEAVAPAPWRSTGGGNKRIVAIRRAPRKRHFGEGRRVEVM